MNLTSYLPGPVRYLLGNPQLTFDDLPEQEQQDLTSAEDIPIEKNAEWRVNNTHNGIEIQFNHKPSEDIRSKMKHAGFRWSRRQGIWYAKDSSYTREIASELADHGEAVGEKLSYAEQVEAERQRAIARQGKLEKAIEKSEAEAESRFETAHKMADIIPFGQPILVGHHSEKSDRSYRARIDSHHRKGVEAYQRAKDLKSRLEGSEKLLAKQENPGAVARKVDKFETELRRLKLHESWYKDKNEFEQKVAGLEEQVDYWKQVLADLGGLKITQKDVKPGDLVKYRGTWYKAKRVNPKSVTIEGWMGIPDWTYLADYSYISDVRRLNKNPRDVIGDPPNSIMRMQLSRLWKEVLGSEDVGDFRTFMKEAADLTYDEARRKLLKTYGTPERIHIKSVKDIEEAFHAQMCEAAEEQCGKGDAEACRTACEDCGIEEVCAPAEVRPAVTWRNFPDHKSETKAVKEALKKAGIEAEVKHGRGTAWGWLEINIGDPGLRNGLRQGPFGSQYTDEERALHDRVLKIAKEVTGRRGDYNGEILVLAQGWRTKSRPEVKRRIDVPVIPKIPEIVPEKKPEIKQIVDSKPKVKRKRQKHSQPEIVMTEFGKTVIKKARGSTIRLTAADMRADAIFIEV